MRTRGKHRGPRDPRPARPKARSTSSGDMPYTPVVPLSHPSCPGFQIAGPSGYLRHLTTYTDVSTRLAWLEERSVRLLASGGRMAIVRKPRSAPVDARAALERSGIWLPDGVTVPGGDTDA